MGLVSNRLYPLRFERDRSVEHRDHSDAYARFLGDVFKHAVHEELLFGEEGRHFKDVVILLAAVDRMRVCTGEVGVIVTDDAQFGKRAEEIARYCAQAKSQLTPWKLADAEAYLSNMLSGVVQERIKRHKELVRQAMIDALPKITSQFNTMLRTIANVSANRRMTLRRIESDARFEKVTDVDIPVLDEEPQFQAEMQVLAYVEGTVQEIHVAGAAEMPGRRKPIKVGVAAKGRFDGASYTILPQMNLSY
jgi:hypothetical protein